MVSVLLSQFVAKNTKKTLNSHMLQVPGTFLCHTSCIVDVTMTIKTYRILAILEDFLVIKSTQETVFGST